MTEHTLTWYESVDGCIFKDKTECIEHELDILYHASGVRFYQGDIYIEHINTKDNYTYNYEISDIFINRSKEAENAAFYDFLHLNYGWCLVDEALEGTGTHYRFIESATAWGVVRVR